MTPSRKNPVPKRVNVIADTPKQPATTAGQFQAWKDSLTDHERMIYERGFEHGHVVGKNSRPSEAAAPDVDVLALRYLFEVMERLDRQAGPPFGPDHLVKITAETWQSTVRPAIQQVRARLMREASGSEGAGSPEGRQP